MLSAQEIIPLDTANIEINAQGYVLEEFANKDATELNLSWNLFHETWPGDVLITGGGQNGLHIANIKVDANKSDIVNFNPRVREPIDGVIETWEISDMFEESELDHLKDIPVVLKDRVWKRKLNVEEALQ